MAERRDNLAAAIPAIATSKRPRSVNGPAIAVVRSSKRLQLGTQRKTSHRPGPVGPLGNQATDRAGAVMPDWTTTSDRAERGRRLHGSGGSRVGVSDADAASLALSLTQHHRDPALEMPAQARSLTVRASG
jgi:hypothetical protein